MDVNRQDFGIFIVTLDATHHGIIDAWTKTHLRAGDADVALQDTPYPNLIVCQLLPFDTKDYLQRVSCLQMTRTGMFFTWHPHVVPLAEQSKEDADAAMRERRSYAVFAPANAEADPDGEWPPDEEDALLLEGEDEHEHGGADDGDGGALAMNLMVPIWDDGDLSSACPPFIHTFADIIYHSESGCSR